MKKSSFLKIFCSLGMVSRTCALDQPKSQMRGTQPDDIERKLFFFNSARGCKKKLEACEEKTGGFNAPVEQMIEQLDQLNLADTTGALSDLKAALVNSEAADYSGFSDRVVNEDIDYGKLMDLGSGMTQAAVENSSAYRITLEIIESVINDIIRVVGAGMDVNLSPVTNLVTAIRRIAARIPNDDLVLTAIFETSRYVASLIFYVVGLLITREEKSEQKKVKKCTAKAMSCEFNALVMNIVPKSIGAVYLADALESAQ